MIKNIFFDFGRTIVGHPEDGAGLQVVLDTGVRDIKDAEIIRDEIFSVEKYMNDLDAGKMTYEEYREMVVGAVPERLRKYADEAVMYEIHKLPLIDGMEELLSKLKNDGYRLFITSNLNTRHAKQMREHRIAKYFDGMIFSAEIKVRKPFREFFEKACEMFDAKPEETVFIDDLAENVEGSEACGIRGFVFNGDAKEAERFIYNN